jgi:hypothetical protein
MSTASTLISAALRKLGVLAAGETLQGNDAVDALEAFNGMLESWRLEGLMSHASTFQIVSWEAATASKTIGSGGVIAATRPVDVLAAVWEVDNVTYPLDLIDGTDWLQLDPDDLTGTPECLFFDADYPLGILKLWPIPDNAGTLKLQSPYPFAAYALGDTISLPPGLERAIIYNLAIELAPEYQIEPSQVVVALARDSKTDVKRNNLRVPRLKLPSNMPGLGRMKSDITNDVG